MVIAVLVIAWRVVLLFCLLLLAGLKTIPESHYRAARMDGAGPWQAFRHITLPAIRPVLLITTVLAIITSLQVFDAIFQLTKGGPGFETTTMTFFIFEAAINQLSLGYSIGAGDPVAGRHRGIQRPRVLRPRAAFEGTHRSGLPDRYGRPGDAADSRRLDVSGVGDGRAR